MCSLFEGKALDCKLSLSCWKNLLGTRFRKSMKFTNTGSELDINMYIIVITSFRSFVADLEVPFSYDMTTIAIRRGFTYWVIIDTVLMISSLSQETIFTCIMRIHGTNFSLAEKTFVHGSQLELKPRASQISGTNRWFLHWVQMLVLSDLIWIYQQNTLK